ncbi:MAG: hypothetical protein AAGF88_02270 [Pseudomonadota bacterium]
MSHPRAQTLDPIFPIRLDATDMFIFRPDLQLANRVSDIDTAPQTQPSPFFRSVRHSMRTGSTTQVPYMPSRLGSLRIL